MRYVTLKKYLSKKNTVLSSTADGLHFVVVKILNLKDPMRLKQKLTYLLIK
jgi:hypothetical protein